MWMGDSRYEMGPSWEQRERERKRQAREAEEKAAAEAGRLRAVDLRLETVTRAVETGSIVAMRKMIEFLAEKYRFTVETRTRMPAGAAAYANWRTRKIVVPPITDEETFAVNLHEIGHILQGQCPNREPHRVDPSVREWWHCLECESDAWRRALRLAPFSKEMFARLQSSLRHYRRTTPGSAEAKQRLDQVAGTVMWATEKQRWDRWKWMTQRMERLRRRGA